MALFCRDLVFHDHSTYVMALADALSQEYQQIAKHGLLLQVPSFERVWMFGPHGGSVDIRRSGLGFVCTLWQVDCPDLGMGRHTRWSDLSEARFSRFLQVFLPDSGAQMKTDIDGHSMGGTCGDEQD